MGLTRGYWSASSIVSHRQEGPVLLDPLLFFKEMQEDDYFNFEMS